MRTRSPHQESCCGVPSREGVYHRTLQSGNFPTFIYDGAGGAVFAWYTSAPALQSFVQHIDANVRKPSRTTVPVSANASQILVEPSAAYTGKPKTSLFPARKNSVQSMSGVYAQKIDATGTRSGATTSVIVPLQVNAEVSERTVQIGNTRYKNACLPNKLVSSFDLINKSPATMKGSCQIKGRPW